MALYSGGHFNYRHVQHNICKTGHCKEAKAEVEKKAEIARLFEGPIIQDVKLPI